MMEHSGSMTSRWVHNIAIVIFIAAPILAGAQEGYVELVGVPNLADPGSAGLGEYVNALYWLAIGIAAVLAVLKLIVAGAKYILSDVVTSKQSAKNDILWSIVGLLIVLSAVIVLNTINPQLTRLDALTRLCDPENPNDQGCVRANLPPPNPLAAIEDAIRAQCSDPAGCVRTVCPIARTYLYCEDWCEAEGGIHIDNGFFTAAECIVPGTNEFSTRIDEVTITGNFSCQPLASTGGPAEYDCSEARANCTAAGGTRQADAGSEIICFRQETDSETGENLGTQPRTIQCTQLPSDGVSSVGYNCSSAEQQCEQSGEIVRERYETYIVCSG